MSFRRLLAVAAALGAATILVALVAHSGGGSHRQRKATVPTSSPLPQPTAPSLTSTPTAPAPAPAGPPALSPPTGEQFGINVDRLFDDRSYTRQAIDAQLRALRQTGATVARSDAFWEFSEPNPPVNGVHHYQWGFDDEVAGALAASGLRWIPIVDYSPAWASTNPASLHQPTTSPADFASFAAAVAARYGSSGTFWRAHPGLERSAPDTYEIWNEPDNAGFWAPAPNAAAYDELYARARDEIRAVDPTARVIVGGLTTPATFLTAMMNARPDLRGHIDGVAIHPYGHSPTDVLAKVRSAREALMALGLGAIPIYVTEFGWTTRPRGALDWLRAQLRPYYIAATIDELGHTDCGIAATIMYTWVTPERNRTDRGDWYGIHPPTGGPSPDSQAFASAIHSALAARPTIRLCAGG